MPPEANPGDIATPPVATPAAPAAPAEPTAPLVPSSSQPNGSEPEINPGGEPAMVPSDRLRQETEKRHEAEQRAKDAEEALANSTPPSASTPDLDEDVEPDVVDAVRKSAKKLGYITKEDLAAERAKDQVQRDVSDLTANPPVPGIPFDREAVTAYAEENGLPITSKNAWVAAYRSANWDKILEAERQRAIDSSRGNGSSAEQPGPGGAVPPAEPEITGKSTKERTRERIHNARQKLAV